MGQGTSQPVDEEGLHNESPDHPKNHEKKSHKKSSKSSKKAKSLTKSTDDSGTKRKRKSLDHGKDSVAPAPPTSSPRDEQSSRPVKRKKTREEDNTEIEVPKSDDGNTEKTTPKTNKQPPTVSPGVDRSPAEQNHVSPKPASKTGVVPNPKIEEDSNSESEQSSENEQEESFSKSSSPAQDKPRQRLLRIENKRRSGKGMVVGHFSPEEVQKIEMYKVEFCNLYGITGTDFDEMVQHAVRDRPFPGVHLLPKLDFWKAIYEVLPNRDRRSIYRFMRRHFQSSSQKPHQWTREQDEELVELYEEHGPKFAFIASLLGRNDDDVVQRWKNRLQHRGTMNRGPWTDEEVAKLRDAIQEAWTLLKADKQNVGADIYEMDERMVAWGAVSDKLQNRRSRQQCGDKWRKLRRKILLERQYQGKDSVQPTEELQQHHMGKKVTGAETNDKNFKNTLSTAYVNSSDDSEEDEDEEKVESPDDENARTVQSDSDEQERTVQRGKKKAPLPSKIPSSKSKPDSDTNSDSDSDTGKSSSESESESSNSSSDSDNDEESHTSMEPNTLQSTKHKQVREQKAPEPVKPSVESESTTTTSDSRGSSKQERPKEKIANAAATPNKHKQALQDSDSSAESSSESDDDRSESSAHGQGSAQSKSQSAKAQPQPSNGKTGTGASASEKRQPASRSESDSSSESDNESENESDMDLDLPPQREPEKQTKPPPREDTNPKPRLSLLKQLKQDIKPAKPSPLIRTAAPAKDSSSSSEDTESSSESSSDSSSDSSSEDEPKQPIKKASPALKKGSTLPVPKKTAPAAKDANSSSADSSSDDDEPAKPVKKGSPKKPKQDSAPSPASKSNGKPAIKPAPKDSESDSDSDSGKSSASSSSSSDESESEKKTKQLSPPKMKSPGQDRPIKRRASSSASDSSESGSKAASSSDSESELEPKSSSKSKPTPTATSPKRSSDQGSKRKRPSTSTSNLARSTASRSIKFERDTSSEPDAKPPVKKTKNVQKPGSQGSKGKNSTPQHKKTRVKKEQYESDSSS